MFSVTQRIKTVTQPRGGYLKPSAFESISFNDNCVLHDAENIHPSLIGIAVDYMTRFLTGTEKETAFSISLTGAKLISQESNAIKLLNRITGVDDTSIINACKLAGYDVCFRAGVYNYKPVEGINPDCNTIENIRIMINRSIAFFNEYGPVIENGITFVGGYTNLVSSGDADFITSDTLWDFKVSKQKINSKQTLQILMYYVMGIHSTNSNLSNITKLGFFNPRLNIVYLINTCDISAETIKIIENDIIGYNGNDSRLIEQLKQDKKSSENPANTPINQKQKSNDEPIIKPVTYTVTDLMKMFNCSRHMIMKYYSEQGLPLTKKGNRYQITDRALKSWIELRKKRIAEEKRRKTIATVLTLIGCIVFIALVFAWSK